MFEEIENSRDLNIHTGGRKKAIKSCSLRLREYCSENGLEDMRRIRKRCEMLSSKMQRP